MLSIEKQIEETDIDGVLSMFSDAPYTPYTYQAAVFRLMQENIRHYRYPFVVKASVSAGKTTIISMVGRRIQELRMPAMVLARQGEIVEQDAAEMWNFGVKNSVFCAGLGMKSVEHPIVVGSEQTVANALMKELANFAPLVLLIDECQHVDVDDLVSSQQRIVKKKVVTTDPVSLEEVEEEVEYQGETLEDMLEAGRAKYTIIIRTLQERCLRVHKRQMRICGLTGTDYRGTQPIINQNLNTPGFWREAICDISTDYLVKFGAVVPTRFGDTAGLHYDLKQFRSNGGDGAQDYSADKLRAMQAAIHDQYTQTQKIMLDVYNRTLDRNAVLVTCAGKKHCMEAAAALPPGTTYCIITDDLGEKKRRELLKQVYDGKIKFTFQIGCLTTGVNIPIWDTGVILRKIGSLTLLVQLIGRTMRKLKDFQIAAGIVKNDAMILDYSETMEELGEMYFNPMLEQYQYEIANQSKEWKTCPLCVQMGKHGRNGEHARRCIAEHVRRPLAVSPIPAGFCVKASQPRKLEFTTERCEYFWKFRLCDEVKDNTGRVLKAGCGVQNDIAARFCRGCGGTLIDPNDNLSSKHYTDGDYYDVVYFSVKPTNNRNSLIFEYTLQDRQDGRSFIAREMFSPASDNHGIRAKWKEAVMAHVENGELARKIGGIRNAVAVLEYADLFRKPVKATHRKGKGNRDVLHKKVF